MDQQDFERFSKALDGCLSIWDVTPTPEVRMVWFKLLAPFSIDDVARGFTAHMRDPSSGKFQPKPAHIIERIQAMAADDGRPGAEQAWALASRASDERATVVWTQEMALAWRVCQPVMLMGDEVGARMAFKETYSALVDDARHARIKPQWTVSEGFDQIMRHAAVLQAETLGLLPPGSALRLAPPDLADGSMTKLLTTSVEKAEPVSDPEVIRERVEQLKAMLVKPVVDPEAATKERAAVQATKDEINNKVQAYQASKENDTEEA